MQNTNKHLRKQLRLIHILASAILGMFIYSPWRNNQTLFLAMGFAIFPIVALTGLWMWQGARLKKWLTQGQTSSLSSSRIKG